MTRSTFSMYINETYDNKKNIPEIKLDFGNKVYNALKLILDNIDYGEGFKTYCKTNNKSFTVESVISYIQNTIHVNINNSIKIDQFLKINDKLIKICTDIDTLYPEILDCIKRDKDLSKKQLNRIKSYRNDLIKIAGEENYQAELEHAKKLIEDADIDLASVQVLYAKYKEISVQITNIQNKIK